jgi:hypothetical protein
MPNISPDRQVQKPTPARPQKCTINWQRKRQSTCIYIVAPVANASYGILAWSYSFQILYEGLPRNLTHSAPAQYPVDNHIQLRFQG